MEGKAAVQVCAEAEEARRARNAVMAPTDPCDQLTTDCIFPLLVTGEELDIEQVLPARVLCAKSRVGTAR